MDQTYSKLGVSSMILTHSLSSCLIFSYLASLYHKTITRLTLSYTNINSSFKERFLFKINLLNNMATPAFVSFYPEFLNISLFYYSRNFILLFFILYILVVCYLTIFLYLISNTKYSNNSMFSNIMLIAPTLN